MKRVQRKKAFVGAAISAVGAIAGLAGNLIMQKKNAKAQAEQQAADQAFAAEQAELDRQAQREQFEAEQNYLKEQRQLEQELADKQWQQDQTAAYKQGALQNAMVETTNLQNQEYVDVMKTKVGMKYGGKFKDRNNKNKKKAGLGADWKAQSSLAKAGDIAGGAAGAITGISSLISGLAYKAPEVVKQEPIKPQVFKPEVLAPVENKQVVEGETYQSAKKKVIKQDNPINNMTTTTPLAKLGKKVKYKSINRFK